ncbi:hypothetical protein ACFU9B_41320 [Streptomyces sp. NPDC057592]|uniref:hypothetical protein n=1 Tax=unclassified Streptomyces TaxID=2593676 RepID=UPI0036844853
MSELVFARIRNTVGKLGRPHLAHAINEYARRADEGIPGLDCTSFYLTAGTARR